MSNLDNVFNSCPGLMADGRTSVNTDYKTKNYTFQSMIGNSSNSYDFRDKLQKSGLSSINDTNKFNLCSPVPYGDVTISKEIKLDYDTTGNFLDAFKPLVSNKNLFTARTNSSINTQPAPIMTTGSRMSVQNAIPEQNFVASPLTSMVVPQLNIPPQTTSPMPASMIIQ